MTSQTVFTAALLDPDLAVPPGLVDPRGRPPGKRFAVYRNNMTVSLSDALEQAFPVVRKLLGDEFFRALAREFLRLHPPENPVLMLYGTALPSFLERFPPVREWGYLPDVARLELAIRRAYHAADAVALSPEALMLPPERLARVRPRMAPAVTAIASAWPIHAIWQANAGDGPAPTMQPEEVLVGRPALDPHLWLLPTGGAAFIDALTRGFPLEQAVAEAGAGFDVAATLTALLQAGAFTDLSEDPCTD
jgi:hypothetical protein